MSNENVLGRFIVFDPVMFLKESKKWKSKIEEKRKELANLPELPAIESDGVMTSSISDMTFKLSLERIKLEQEIEVLETSLEIRDWALNNIPSFDRELIEGFFFPKVSIYRFIEDFGRENCLCRSDVYVARREALDAFTELITTRYGIRPRDVV